MGCSTNTAVIIETAYDNIIVKSAIIAYTVSVYFKLDCRIKTHDSESRGQEEAAVRDERVSDLHQDSR